MAKNFADIVREKGSVSAALASQGYTKNDSGGWSKGGASGSSSSSSGSSSGSSQKSGGGSASGGYYDAGKDYSLAIKQAQQSGASSSVISQLQQERQNKIDAQYGGVDPYRGSSNIMGGTSGGTGGGGAGGVYDVPVIPGSGAATSDGTTKWAVRDGADMSRRPDLAGRTAISGGYTVFYDQNGYAVKAIKGTADYTPHVDQNVTNGSYNTAGAWTDGEMLSAADRARIADIRARMQSGQLTGDEANAQANAIRSGYGYTIDKEGRVTDLRALGAVNDRREQWGLSTGADSSYQQAFQDLWDRLGPAAPQKTGGQTVTYPSYGPGGGNAGDDLSAYLKDLYAAQMEAQLAKLKAAYEQNAADVRANDDLISDTYAAQKNQAAAQNELQRMQMNEFAGMRGLNTGASGQLALAQSAALQGSLAGIGTQEAQSLSENALNLQKLTAAYRSAVEQAEASGNAELAGALYDEYVRQASMTWQRQQAALEQERWLAQFQAGQQQYQTGLAGQDREYAYNLAMTMLGAGAMPDAATLAAAGISSAEALQMKTAAEQQSAVRSVKSDGTGGKPALTYNQVMDAEEAPSGKYTMGFDELKNTINRYLALGGKQRAQNIVDQYWDSLTTAQQQELHRLYNGGGLTK